MNILRRASKKKEDEQRALERAEENKRIRDEWFEAWNEYWQRILDAPTDRRASIEELSEDTILVIRDIIMGKWFSGLPRKLAKRGEQYRLFLWASEDTENPYFFVSIGGWPEPHSYRQLILGRYNDGVDVLKSRYNLVDALLQKGYAKVMAYERDETLRRNQMLNEIRDMIYDAP